MQAENSTKARQLQEAQQKLAEALAAHERHVIEADARSQAQEADAVRQKTEELMQQKELLDRRGSLSLSDYQN